MPTRPMALSGSFEDQSATARRSARPRLVSKSFCSVSMSWGARVIAFTDVAVEVDAGQAGDRLHGEAAAAVLDLRELRPLARPARVVHADRVRDVDLLALGLAAAPGVDRDLQVARDGDLHRPALARVEAE